MQMPRNESPTVDGHQIYLGALVYLRGHVYRVCELEGFMRSARLVPHPGEDIGGGLLVTFRELEDGGAWYAPAT